MPDDAPNTSDKRPDDPSPNPPPRFVIYRPSLNPRDRAFWNTLGWVGTALWIAYVLVITGGRMEHPLFDWIFLVPLIGWVVLMIISRIVARSDGGPKAP